MQGGVGPPTQRGVSEWLNQLGPSPKIEREVVCVQGTVTPSAVCCTCTQLALSAWTTVLGGNMQSHLRESVMIAIELMVVATASRLAAT